MLFLPEKTSPLRDILRYYVQTISPTKRSYKTEIYRIKALSEILGDLPLDSITPMHVVAFRDQRLATEHPRIPGQTLATSTVKLELMLLSHVFSTAITEWGMEHLVNPVLKVRKPKAPPGRCRRLSTTEERKLLRAAIRHPNREFYAVIVLALETACRQGEILSMRWEHVSWTKRTVLLPLTKNGDAREVPLSRKAYSILHDHLERKGEGRIFEYSTAGIKSTWRSFCDGLQLENLHFHDLRHCAISSLLERGLNTIEVASISGHKSMSMLKRYSHLSSYKLVPKLDPKPRPKKDRPILRKDLVPYPAIVTSRSRRVDVDFPDFLNLRVSERSEEKALEQAQNTLLRTVIGMLCDGAVAPMPSDPVTIELIDRRSRIEMIAPL
jgi:integrase